MGGDTKLGRAVSRGFLGVVKSLSLDVMNVRSFGLLRLAATLPFRTNASRHRFEKTIHNVKYRSGANNAVLPRVNHEDLVHFIIQDRKCLRARVPVSRSKAAPCGRASQRWPFWKRCAVASLRRLRFCELVEPIGIEPMT